MSFAAFAQWQPATPAAGAPISYTNGSVGIGTSAPANRLHVISTANNLGDGLRISASDYVTSGAYLIFNKNSGLGSLATIQAGDKNSWDPLFLNPYGGYVGIGTSTAPKRLTVQTSNGVTGPVTSMASMGANVILLDTQNSSNNEKTGIVTQFANGGMPAAVVFGREGTVWGTSIGLYTHNDDSAAIDQMAERLHVSATGRVGIGTTAPVAMLDVAGNVNISGSLSATTVIGAVYQDVAEWVPSSEHLPAGTVVIINPSKKNEVTPSLHAYDTAVAGVVSDKPGVLLGVASDDKSKIATTGRVRVRVDATRHAIAAGDLLVTSDTPGVAMRSEPVVIGDVKIHRPGTLIGKALEPLSGGSGEILVLLSLQ